VGRGVDGKTYLIENKFSRGGDDSEDEQENEEDLADGEVAEAFASLQIRVGERPQDRRGREGVDAAQMRRSTRRGEVLHMKERARWGITC